MRALRLKGPPARNDPANTNRRPNPWDIISQMRCRECAARVGATARVCSRCGAPIVGQGAPIVGPPAGMADAAVAETVTDTIVRTVSDAAGKGVPAGLAGQALPEPFVPGSGDS